MALPITQNIRLTSFAQISASPKLRICWKRYMKCPTPPKSLNGNGDI